MERSIHRVDTGSAVVSMELLNEKVNLETVSSVLPIWCLRTGFLINSLKKINQPNC